MNRYDTYSIRNGAAQFQHVAVQFLNFARRVQSQVDSLVSPNVWKGDASESFQTLIQSMLGDLGTFHRVLEETQNQLTSLADDLALVNDLRQRAEEVGWRISNLQDQLSYAEDQQKQHLHNEIYALHYQQLGYQNEADTIYNQADSRAKAHFENLHSTLGRLEFIGKWISSPFYSLPKPQSSMSASQLNAIVEEDVELEGYLKEHPDAVGPSHESNEQFLTMLQTNAEEARNDGATSSLGIPTVFIHGLNGSSGTYANMMRGMDRSHYLSASGRWVRDYDHVGPYFSYDPSVLFGSDQESQFHKEHGFDVSTRDSDGNLEVEHPMVTLSFQTPLTSSWENETDYLDPVMKDVASQYGTKHVNIVGHSQGGLVGLNYAEKHPQDIRVDKFVSLDTPFFGGNDPIMGNDLRMGYPDSKLGIYKSAYLILPPENDPDRQRAMAALGNAEVLSVYGSDDAIVTQRSAFGLQELPLPNFKTIEFDNYGHSSIHDSTPENAESPGNVDQYVNDFLFGTKP